MCGRCKSKDIELECLDEKTKGFSVKFCIKCAACDWTYFFNPAKAFSMANRDSRGAKSQEIIVRTVMAFREIGQGHQAMKIFASILNMPSPITLKSFNKINSNLLPFYEATSCDCMKDAVTEVRKNVCPTAAENNIIDIQIGIYGSWQKRGHSSLNGVCTAVAKTNRKINLRYSHYIGYGDTESYKNVVKAKPYGDDLVPVKIECVGHVQKRLGTFRHL